MIIYTFQAFQTSKAVNSRSTYHGCWNSVKNYEMAFIVYYYSLNVVELNQNTFNNYFFQLFYWGLCTFFPTIYYNLWISYFLTSNQKYITVVILAERNIIQGVIRTTVGACVVSLQLCPTLWSHGLQPTRTRVAAFKAQFLLTFNKYYIRRKTFCLL